MVDVKGHLMFDGGVSYGVKDWWIGTIALAVINVVLTLVVGMVEVAILGTVVSLLVGWAALGLWVGRLRDRGHTEIIAYLLRIVIFPWGLVECAFMGSAE
jgi:uncharacterized membrane protein YhaH (DUF805 family)